MATNGYIKFFRNSEKYGALVKERPSAFVLLSLIAARARRTNGNEFQYGLGIGEALVGDFETYGVTRGVYRTDIKHLVAIGAITIQTNWKGTKAKLVDSTIFDINQDTENQDDTTNKNIKLANKREIILVREPGEALSTPSSSFQLALKEVEE